MDEVRFLKKHEMRQRGCEICVDMQKVTACRKIHYACPHERCPYKVLDKYETYDEFLESEDSKIIVPEFFKTVAECCSMAQVGSNPVNLYFTRIERRF